jgi:hypothetical protein
VVVTPRVEDRLGSYIVPGTDLIEIADVSTLRARIYVSEHDMYKLHLGATGRIMLDGGWRTWSAQAKEIAPLSAGIAPGLTDLSKYAGMSAPNFYVVDLVVANSQNQLKPGMVGTARVYGERRSLAGLIGREIANFLGRKLW